MELLRLVGEKKRDRGRESPDVLPAPALFLNFELFFREFFFESFFGGHF